ncbi:nucleotide disphospho-sugar-binding domain-containing protein [Bradyrhizobium sp. Ai1a-2]|uniref:glycosyltransferase n=1 Tax=Bradyrhizobium sp. Ai1a-2 TaxID=196490 RepID=UPI0031B8A33A
MKFISLPASADFDLRELLSVAPELKDIPAGPEWLRVCVRRVFIDPMAAQHQGLLQAIRESPVDMVLCDDTFLGALPMLLGAGSKRPSIVVCGTTFLRLPREDGAPNFLGLPPATTEEQRQQYAAMARQVDEAVNQPNLLCVNETLNTLGVGTLPIPASQAIIKLADAYLQLSVPSFEFPRKLPPTVHFVGTPPIVPNQAPVPSWAADLDGKRKVVLVTQGTVANHNFGLLVAPTLAALADEPDLLVVVTTGGRPVDAIPGPIPSNARVSTYLPFEWILKKTDVFVTNGGYGSVNQAMSFGIPIVSAGLTEDKADVNARIAWSGVGINLATNQPDPRVLREAVRTVLEKPGYRTRAASMADEFAGLDTRSEILSIIRRLVADRKATVDFAKKDSEYTRNEPPPSLARML